MCFISCSIYTSKVTKTAVNKTFISPCYCISMLTYDSFYIYCKIQFGFHLSGSILGASIPWTVAILC